MWRTSGNLLKSSVTCAVRGGSGQRFDGFFAGGSRLFASSFCSTTTVGGGGGEGGGRVKDGDNNNCGGEGDWISYAEAKRLMRLVNVDSLKVKLGMENKEVIGYRELLEACESMGLARSEDEAAAFARVLDEAGVVLLFRDKVYLHPNKVVDLVRKAMPLALLPDNDPSNEELKRLQEKKEELDMLAHKQVRRILWTGLGLALAHVGLFFRLTFWEFSWDVMEPIAFFATTSGIVIGYAYFLFTSRDPTYQDFMKRLLHSRQRKLIKKNNFDIEKFKELQEKCKSPLDVPAAVKHRIGASVDRDDLLHGH